MMAGQWEEVKTLFHLALQEPAANRAVFLHNACKSEPVLVEVMRLLEQHDKVGDFLTAPAWAELSTLTAQPFGGHPPFSGTPRFAIQEQLGEGTFGIVYRVLDRERNAMVALKTLRRLDAVHLSRFKNEFRSLVDLVHPNLVQLYELFGDDNAWFFTMELVEGTDFLSYTRPHDLVHSWDRIRDVLAQLTSGVQALHSSARLHRDLKPSNVLVSKAGRVLILDFGLVKELDSMSAEQSTALAGSPAYMAPEQVGKGPITPAVDWYAVGVMLYRAITGVLPFQGNWQEILQRKQAEDAPNVKMLNPDVPEDLSTICNDLLRRSPELRADGPSILSRLQLRATPSISKTQDPFVGRLHELELLEQCFQRLGSGGHQVVLLHGPSGIGKTTFLDEFLGRVALRNPDTVILRGRCRESESLPFKALDSVADQLVRYLRALPTAIATAMLPRHPALLARMFPCFRELEALSHFAERLDNLIDEQEIRRRAFAAFCETLDRITDRHPVIISIDDLQWGDLDSVALLSELVLPLHAPRLMLILTFRSEDADSSPPVRLLRTFRARLTNLQAWTEIALSGLDEKDGSDFLRSLDRDLTLTEEQLRGMVGESLGSPLFLRELLRASSQGMEQNEFGKSTAYVGVAEMILRRIKVLTPVGRQLIEAISVAVEPLSRANLFNTVKAPAAELSREISLLVHENLVRVTGGLEIGKLEPFHDQVREASLTSMLPSDLERWHSRLAETFEAEGSPDPQKLVRHYLGAGNMEAAYRSALAAAKIAEKALAFDRAASFYAAALETGEADEPAQASLHRQRAETLAKAGRGYESAQCYLEAARWPAHNDVLEMRRSAAEQLIRSGYLDEGTRLFTDLLRSIGVDLPTSRIASLLRMLTLRAFIRVRGLRWRERTEAEVPATALRKLDLLWAGAMALVSIDTISGSYLQALHMLAALRAGEPSRLSLSLSFGAVYESMGGTREYDHGRKLIHLAQQIADRQNDPYLLAMTYGCWAGVDFLSGRIEDGLSHCRTSVAGLNAVDRRARAWELGTFNMVLIWFLGWGGRIRELSDTLPLMAEEARSRGDVYSEVYLRCCGTSHLIDLAADNPEQAMAKIDTSIQQWRKTSYDLPHFYATFARVECLLYAGRAQDARQLLLSDWEAIQRSLFTRKSQIHKTILFYLRGRTALAEWFRHPNARELRDEVEQFAERLAKLRSLWADALSIVFHAGVMAGLNRQVDAVLLLDRAEEILRKQDLRLLAAAVSRRRGELEGEQGSKRVEMADAFMTSENIIRPDRMTAMFLPGRWL